MGLSVEAGKPSSKAGAKPPRLILDPENVALGDGDILVKHAADGGYFCLGFGSAASFLRAVDEAPAFDDLVDTGRVGELIIKGPESSLAKSADLSLRRLGAAVALAKGGYNPDEARDEGGRWTGSGGAAATAGAAAADLFSAPALIPALRQFVAGLLPSGAAGVGGAVAALGVLVIPTNRSLISEGSIPDEPGLSYRFDQGTGVLTFTRERDDGNKEVIFEGRRIGENVFQDREGNVIGRDIGGSLVIDPDMIPAYRSNAADDASSQSGVGTDAAVNSKPKLCPDPGPDKPGRKTEKDIAYEMYVGTLVNGEPLGYGLAVRLMSPVDREYVYFDNCRLTNGDMIDAKGTGYLNLRGKKSPIPWLGAEAKMLRQSERQIEAAQGRPIEWYFAEKEIADHVRDLFARNNRNIAIIYASPPDLPIFKCEFLLDEGAAPDELRHISAVLP
ncbi:MAG TPA: hypothetical protein VJR47_10825 [Stellaceae bacterium]|nr:hypothetical protein [Stellaceae bacterium]